MLITPIAFPPSCRKVLNEGDGYENVTEKWSSAALNRISLFPSRSIRQILAIFSEVDWILEDCIEVQEKKKKVVVSSSRPPQKAKECTI